MAGGADLHHLQDEVLHHSLNDPKTFWAHQADHLHWHKKPTSILEISEKKLKSGVTHDTWTWFPDGEISTCFNCVDRHVHDGHGSAPAIYYDSPVTATKQTITYAELLYEVETLAGVLREQGVKRGDVVLVYSMSPPISIRYTLNPIFPDSELAGVCPEEMCARRGRRRLIHLKM